MKKSAPPGKSPVSLKLRIARQYVRKWGEDLDTFEEKFKKIDDTILNDLILNELILNELISKKMKEENIPMDILPVIQQALIERFRAIRRCNDLRETLELDKLVRLNFVYVNDAIDVGKTLFILMPKKEDEKFLDIVMDEDIFNLACECGYFNLIKEAYAQAKSENENFRLIDLFEYYEGAGLARAQRHLDLSDWLLDLVRTETTDDDQVIYYSIVTVILIISREEQYDEFKYLWSKLSDTNKRKFSELMSEKIDDPTMNFCGLLSYLVLTDRETFDELVKFATMENEKEPSQGFILSIFKRGFDSESFAPEVADIIFEYATKVTREKLKTALMEIHDKFSDSAMLLCDCKRKDIFDKIMTLFLDDQSIQLQQAIARDHLLSNAIYRGDVKAIVEIWNSYDKEDQKRLIIGVFSFILKSQALEMVDTDTRKNLIDLFNSQIQEFKMQDELENHLHDPDFSEDNRTKAYLIWLLYYDENNSEASRIINFHKQRFFPDMSDESLVLLQNDHSIDEKKRFIVCFPMIYERLHQCISRISDNIAGEEELFFIEESKKMLRNTLKKVMCVDAQQNDCLFNLVFHVLNKITNPKLKPNERDYATSKARHLLRLLNELVISAEDDPVLLQCQLVSRVLQNRGGANWLLDNAKWGGHALASKFKTKLFNPFDGQPSRSTTEDCAILLYQALEKEYSSELEYQEFFPTSAMKIGGSNK